MRLNFRRTIGRAVSLAGVASLLLAGATSTHAQTTWEAMYEYDGEDVGRSVVLLDDNTVVAAGETKTVVGISTDVYVVKTDGCYNPVWEHAYDLGGNDKVGRIRSTTDGGFIIVGTTQSLNNPNCDRRDDLFLLKLDAVGAVQWAHVYGGEDAEEGYDVKLAGTGYVAVGRTRSYGMGQWDGYMVSADASGNRLWAKSFGGDQDDRLRCCVVTSTGNVVAAGTTHSYGANIYGDLYLISVDLITGTPTPGFAKRLGRDGGEYPASIVEDVFGDLIIAGETTSGLIDYEGFLLRTNSSGFPSVFNVFNGIGPLNARDGFNDMQIHAPSGTYLVVGTFEDNATGYGNTDLFMGIADAYLNFTTARLHGGHLDEQGYGVSGFMSSGVDEFVGVGLTTTFGSTAPDLFMVRQNSINNDRCDGLVPSYDQYTPGIEWHLVDLVTTRPGEDCARPVASRSEPPTAQLLCYWCPDQQGNRLADPVGGDDPNQSVASVNAPGSGSAFAMNLYPNPVGSQRTLVLEHRPAGDAMMTVSVSDITGKLVTTGQHSASTGRLEINTEGWAAGAYLVRMTIGGTTESRVITVLDK